jgi:hypothetical protein
MGINKESTVGRLFLPLLCLGSFLFFGIFYEQHIYRQEQLQLFELTWKYLLISFTSNGGLVSYLGEFLVQFFHLPFAGAFIITLLFYISARITRLILLKVTLKTPLLIFYIVPPVAYLILLIDDYYLLSGLIGLLFALSAALLYLKSMGIKQRILMGIGFIILVYWLAGGAYLVLLSVIILSELLNRIGKQPQKTPLPSGVLLFFVLIAAAIPFIAREYIFRDTILQSFLSGSYYKICILFPLPLIFIFSSFPLCILFQSLLSESVFHRYKGVPYLLTIAGIITAISASIILISDFKEEDEMAYENLVYREKWGKIINKAEIQHPVSNISMTAVNLALANRGELSSKMFSFNQNSNSLFPVYIRKGMTPFIASEPFFHCGMINFSQMFALETIESTPDARYPSRSFRRAAETFIINGQYDIAKKYLIPLSHTLFQRKWAIETLSLLSDKEMLNKNPYWSAKRALVSKYDFYYDAAKMDYALQAVVLSNPGNRTAYEYLMANCLLKKDLDGFLRYLPLAKRMNYSALPLSWQEATVYIATRIQRIPEEITGYSINDNVFGGIKDYAKLFSAEKIDTALIKEKFGQTYWYYLHFSN